MSQRPCAKTQGVSLKVAWQGIAWKKVQRHVFRLQKRIYRAAQREDVSTVHKLQKLLVKSWYARLLAVRRITQDNRGKHTAGIDGAKTLTPPQRWRLANELHLDGTATALRRIWIPKRGSTTEKRPLGIPTQADRARQTVVRQALEPAWEAKLSPHTYGFRPGRSCHDAIGAIFTAIRFRPQHALKLDIAKCFDRIDHQALLAKVQAPPRIRRQLKAWLKAGILEDGHLSPTTAGTPQGGSCSPLLALIALHGMDQAITRAYPHARVIAYADDGVVLHEERQVLEHCHELLKTWLAEMGLSLNEAKCRIAHTLEGDQPGFEFLGFDIRQYRVSKYQAGKGPGGHGRLGFKTLIKPAKVKVQDHLAALGRIIKRGKALPQGPLIRQLNPIIRGWANYYRVGVSYAVYERLDHLTWIKLRHWARWRHPRKSTAWAIRRYWHRVGTRLTFATSATDPDATHLLAHSEVPITRHVKVQGNRSPYDGDWVYWSTRQGRPPNVGARLARLLKQPHGCCRRCGRFFQHDDRIEVDHINGNHRDSRPVNLQALHGHCHDAKTREHGDYLPPGLRDKPQNTEERREANAEWMGAKQGIHDFLRAYFHVKSADWKGNNPFPLQAFSATELAKMPRYYIMDLDKTMPENVAPDMPTPEEIAANTWLTDEELRVYSSEFGRTSFQGGLNSYRLQTDPSFSAELRLYSGATIDVPSMFISGKSDWGAFQRAGRLEAMRDKICTDLRGIHLLDGAGHWVQQEQPEAVVKLLTEFLQGQNRVG